MLVKNYIKATMVTSVTLLFVAAALNIEFGTTNPFYVVSSESMKPMLQIGDIVVVQKNIPFDKIKIGDVIAFSNPSEKNEIIVHRVAQVMTENPFQIRTKGDANHDSIPGTDMPIAKNNYVGKVAYVIPHLGYVQHALSPPVNYIIAVSMMGIILVNFSARQKQSSRTNLQLKE